MNKKLGYILLTVAVALISCSKEPFEGRGIRVKVTTFDTKGTVTTTAGLVSSGSFVMDAYIAESFVDKITYPDSTVTIEPCKYIDSGGDANVWLNAGSWTIDGAPTWVAGTTTRFWAWHPVSLSSDVFGPSNDGTTVRYGADSLAFSYSTPTVNGTTDATRAEDIIFAYGSKVYEEGSTDAFINLTFHHALSQVRFCVSTDDGTFDPGLKISNITITNLKTYGEAFFNGRTDGFIWSGRSGASSFGQNYNASFKTLPVSGWTAGSYSTGGKTYNLHTCQNVFFMIPQTVSTNTSDDTKTNYMKVTFDADGKTIVKSVPIADATGDEWLPDRYYTYKINATIVGRDIEASISLMDWSDRDDTIFI